MASITFQHVDLSAIWEPELVHHPKFRAAVDLVMQVSEFDDKSSWLVQMIYEDRYTADEEEDECLLARYEKSDRTNYSWYFALQMCDQYAFIMGTYLELRFPDREWVIAYTPDHYFCLEKQESYEGVIPIYDLCGQCRIESGLGSPSTEWMSLSRRWATRHVIRSVAEHSKMVATRGYD